MTITTIQPIPLDIRKELSDPHIPWTINKRIFSEMKSQNATSGYKKVQVLPTDPDWRFVWRYFHHDKPNHYNIKKIYCIHERHQQQAFELNLSSMEKEATKFKPKWHEEPRALQRAQAIERWKQSANIFSPFSSMETDGRRKVWNEVKLLPLWHGSSEEVCESIAASGFVHFGKISLGGSTPKSTDEGFFGSGIYFTNSARYASDIYSRGHIFLAWVSMREPFPIVGDSCQLDMKAIKGKGAYKDYNAHYIPVTSINPSDPYESIYYPTKENEIPHCDEIVVFQKFQTLPRFWIELEVELPYAPSDTPQFVNELIPHIMKFLQNSNVDRDQKLRNFLCKELEILINLPADNYLEERHETIYEQLKQIFDSQGKVNRRVSNALTATPQPSPTSPIPQSFVSEIFPQPTIPHQPVTSNIESIISKPEKTHKKKYEEKDDGFYKLDSLFSKQTAISNTKGSSSIPSIAFGKAKWKRYFGNIGVEPPLPANIKKILKAYCPFWPDKKIQETHLLVLIPNTVNGKPFTMNYLGELIKKPNSKRSTKYRFYYDGVEEAIGDKSYPSHWILMTRDIIPGSKKMDYLTCCNMIANYSKKTGIPYELPHLLEATTAILMHYFKTGERIYGDDPHIWTISQDVDKANNQLFVGGFTTGGLSVSDYRILSGAAGCIKL